MQRRKFLNDVGKDALALTAAGSFNWFAELTSNYVAPVRSNDFPVLEYDFYSFNTGPVDVYTYMVPTFPLSKDHGNRYGVMVDNSPVYLPEANAPYYTTLWIQSILRNTRINKTTHDQ